MMEFTKECLRKIDDPILFERICCSFLVSHGYMVIPQGIRLGVKDGGKDAIIASGFKLRLRHPDNVIMPIESMEHNPIICCFSIAKDYVKKIIRDQRNLIGTFPIQDISEILFCSTSEITPTMQDNLKRQAFELFGWKLTILDLETISLFLSKDREGQKIRKEFLKIDIEDVYRTDNFKSSMFSTDYNSISRILSYTKNINPPLFELMCQEWIKTNKQSYTTSVLKSGPGKVQLSNVWYEMSIFMIRETKSLFRGMSVDFEISNFWNSQLGNLYYTINANLVHHDEIIIRRIIILPDITNDIVNQVNILNLLKSCYLQQYIGCDLRVVPFSFFEKYMCFKCNYFAIQDNEYLLLCDLNNDCATIITDGSSINDAIEYYDELFSSESEYSFSLDEYLNNLFYFDKEMKAGFKEETAKKADKIVKGCKVIVPFWKR